MSVRHSEAPAADGRAGGGAASLFGATNYPIFRINPAPATSLLAAGHAEDGDLLWQLAGLRQLQAETAEATADALYAMAPQVPDAVRTGLVLPLRRAVHNQRTTSAHLDLQPLAELAGYELVASWVSRQQSIGTIERQLVAVHQERLHEEREALREVLFEESVQRSLAMSSPLLPAAADRYRSRSWTELDKRGRKSEKHLLRYALRASGKTSPFSQYTVIGYPHDEHGAATDEVAVTSTITLNLAYVRRLEAALRRAPGSREQVKVHGAPGLRVTEGRLVGVGQRDALGSQAADIADRYGEAQISIPASPVALAVLGWLRQQVRGEATVEDLVALLAAKIANLTQEEALRYVHHLQDCAVLATAAIVPDQSTDPLTDLRSWLDPLAERHPQPVMADVARHLSVLAHAQRELAGADARHRVELLRSSEAAAADLLTLLGDDPTARPLPTPLWYEDARLTGPTPDASGPWSQPLQQVGELLDLLHVFDEQHVFMRVLRHRFVERFGPGGSTGDLDELASLYLPAYDDALQINEGFDHPLLQQDPVLASIAALRESLLAPLREQLLRSRPHEEVRLPPERLDQVRAELPEWCTQRPSSYAVFLQPCDQRPGAGAVLNKIYNGWGNYVSRFLTHAPGHVLDRVREAIRGHIPEGELAAEFRPVNGFNANVHPLLTPGEIDVTGRPEPGQLALDELDVRHDVAADRVELVHRPSGTRVHPLYLGFLIPYYLPSRLVPLTAIAGSGSIMFEPQVSADRTEGVDRSTIRSYPRVVWKDLVIARRRWIVPAAQIPLPRGGETEEGYFLRFNAWRTAAGLPDELFLHPPAPELEPGQVNDYFGSYLSNRKPQFFAATGRLHCLHLSRLLVEQPGADVVFEEALPAPSDALAIAGGRHVSELVVDYYRTADQEHQL